MNPIVVVCFKRVLLRRWLIKLGAPTLAEKPLCYLIDKFSVFSVRLKKKNSKNRALNVLHCIFVGRKGNLSYYNYFYYYNGTGKRNITIV